MQKSPTLRSATEPLALIVPGLKRPRYDCDMDDASRTLGGAEGCAGRAKSPFRKKKKRSTMEAIPQGLFSSFTQMSEVVLYCANVKNNRESDSLALMINYELKG